MTPHLPINGQTAWTERKPIICSCGDHAFVAATRGYTTMVSPEDAHFIEEHWNAVVLSYGAIISKNVGPRAARKNIVLARQIMCPPHGMHVDHKNNDPTDNRRENLRVATPAQNAWNRRKQRGSKNPFKGVAREPSGRYRASIMAHGQRRRLGTFDTAIEAREAYLRAAERLHGEFARAG